MEQIDKQSDGIRLEIDSDNHHPFPKFRIPKQYKGGKNSLIGEWAQIKTPSKKAHRHLHIIFGDRFPQEQVKLLEKICDINGFLDTKIYTDYKKSFDILFGGNIPLAAMKEILKRWDLSEDTKRKYSNRIALIFQVAKNKISGGISLKKFGLK